MGTGHIKIIEHEDGYVSFECVYCGVVVGPVKSGPALGRIELMHHPQCVFLEAGYLNRQSWAGRHDH